MSLIIYINYSELHYITSRQKNIFFKSYFMSSLTILQSYLFHLRQLKTKTNVLLETNLLLERVARESVVLRCSQEDWFH